MAKGPRAREAARPSVLPPAARPAADVARKLFHPTGREPYYLRDLAIRNFDELHAHLEKFTEEQAGWVADWVDYLGDRETARRIRKETKAFKKIIAERHKELKAALEGDGRGRT
ncbi:MAG: hypothetical protein QXO51_00605 [Halobacteria archaeon]